MNFSAVEDAARRIAGKVRRTPMMKAAPTKTPIPGDVVLKLECLQVTGSFKPRGAMNTLATLDRAELRRGLVTASGGNHGLGVAYAAHQGGAPATIFLPASAPAAKAEKLRAWGAEVIVEGAVWDDSNRAAQAHAEKSGAVYVHPFADERVVAGQGTLALEILDDAPETETLIVAIGGGGLIAGVGLAAKARKPGIRIVGVEPVGAPTLHESLKAGRVIELPSVSTAAGTLAPRRSDELNYRLIRDNVEAIVLVTDEEMREAARLLWFEMGVAAELSGAAALAALLAKKYVPRADEKLCPIVCGAGTDGLT